MRATLSDSGESLFKALQKARVELLSSSSALRQKTLFVFTDSVEPKEQKAEIVKLLQTGVKVIFIVDTSELKDELNRGLNGLVTVIQLGDKVTSNEINEGQNEIPKGMA